MDGKVTDSSKMDQIQSYDYRKNEKRREDGCFLAQGYWYP